jgi:hypothetical protein
MSVPGEIFHKLLRQSDLSEFSNIHEDNIRAFLNARAYYESISESDKQEVRTYVRNNSCILQIVIGSGIFENVRYLHEVMGVDLAMDNNIALEQAWKTLKYDICIWLLQIIRRQRISSALIHNLIKYAILNGLINMLDVAYEYLNADMYSTILRCKFDSNKNFMPAPIINWIQTNITELQPQYESVNGNIICVRFIKSEIRHIPEIVDIAECPVCLNEEDNIKGHILHLNHAVCTVCYERLYNSGLHNCPLCRKSNVIL